MKFKRIFSLLIAAIMMTALFAVNVSAAGKSVKLSKSSVSVTVGKTTTLKATVTGCKKYTLVWSTSDKSVVTVAAGGKLTGKSAGTATVSVKIKGTDYKASCKVTVKKASSNNGSSVSSKDSGNALEFVKNIKIGMNIGNTLDAISGNGLSSETSWGNPKITEDLIKTIKKAGFNTVRIPVSWGNHTDSSNKIDKAWMDRVQQVVDYAIDNDMYVILNTHHEGSWLIPSSEKEKAVTKKYTAIWEQICERFKNYDEHLIFEGMNEPKTDGSANEWTGGTAAERKIVNNLNQAFIDTVRASGGNNKTRYLMITPYAASSSYSALKDLTIPNDSRIIVSVHAYIPYNMALNRYSDEKTFTESGKKDIDNFVKTLNDLFVSKGTPVIIGEMASLNKENTAERAKLAEYYVSSAAKAGIPCVWWDNGTKCPPSQGEGLGILDRSTLTWWYKDIVDALMKGAKNR